MDDKLLETIQGPSRFLGNETNAAKKDLDRAQVKVALLFPDAYDLGMSHLGYKIVYHALNAAEGVACERAFTPEPELEAHLRRLGRPLTSLESGRRLGDFDLVGVSLPHEMAATNVLTLLDLGGIPLLAAERSETDPIVLAGGPAAFSPEPLADFFDAVLLGDGEEAAVEIARLVGRARAEGRSRRETIESLAQLGGVYVPSLYRPVFEAGRLTAIEPIDPAPKTVTKRTLPDLDVAFALKAPLVPYGKPVHDRLSIELARGCTRGCRFCQAGMIYRPVRERSPKEVYNLTLASLKRTGYDELSLLSLSAGDYSCLNPLLTALMARLGPERVSVSLPSLRVDSLTPQTAELIRRVRATGFTLAPEAGSARLRAVINKNITEDEILTSAETALEAGWRLLKFYFMLGLPTETEEDLESIVELVRAVSKRAPGLRLNVSLSPFVPKPHTPFQWEAQLVAEEAQARIRRVKSMFRRVKGVRIKWNSALVAQLEGLLSRGDRRLGRVIWRAWRNGARFEAWSEHFDWRPWAEALAAEGLSLADYLAERPLDALLPWDHLAVSDKEFLLAERAKASAAEQTPDCRTEGCQGCGVCDFETIEPVTVEGQAVTIRPPADRPTKPRRVAFTYQKLGPARFLGHLEMASIFQRAFRRAGIRLAYSQGFHPQPKLSFFEALPVGAESLDEYAQAEILDSRDLKTLLKALSEQLPEGLTVTCLAPAERRVRPAAALYRISLKEGVALPEEGRIDEFMARESVPYERRRPNKVQRFDLRPAVVSFSQVYPGEYELTLIPAAQGPTPRPEEVVGCALGLEPSDIRVLKLKTIFEGETS